MKVYYLGQFPPPYGGVTVKNALLAEALADRVPVEKVGFRDVGTVKIVRLLMTSKDGLFMLGLGVRTISWTAPRRIQASCGTPSGSATRGTS